MHWLLFFCFILAIPFLGNQYPIHNGRLIYPSNWPSPVYDFSVNPLDSQKIALGRKLFYDPILSLDSSISCSSCHLPYTAFTHVDHALSHGLNDRIGKRNAPSLVNLAWSSHFMWDGAIRHLDMQSIVPMTHINEMGESLPNILRKLESSTEFSQLFKHAFKSESVSIAHLLKALSQFQLILISNHSRYDRYMAGELLFNEQEERGLSLFKEHCSSCHQPPLFTTGAFKRNGLRIDSVLNDLGRYDITGNPLDSMRFKVPTLRNIAYTFPYMHDGRFSTLTKVLDHYQKVGARLDGQTDFRKVISITDRDKIDLIAFLRSLSDRSFMFNTATAFPPIQP